MAKEDLEDSLTEKKDELAQIKDDLVITQKALIEKDFFLQKVNNHLTEQIPKIFSKSEVLGDVKGSEKGNKITSLETTLESPYFLFFQYAIIFVIILLIIYICFCVFWNYLHINK